MKNLLGKHDCGAPCFFSGFVMIDIDSDDHSNGLIG